MAQSGDAVEIRQSDAVRQASKITQGQVAVIVNKIHAAKNPDDLFLGLREDLQHLFDVEQLTLYAVDREKRELYSKYLLDPIEGVQEIRVPITDQSISGYCARHGRVFNIADAYDQAESCQ